MEDIEAVEREVDCVEPVVKGEDGGVEPVEGDDGGVEPVKGEDCLDVVEVGDEEVDGDNEEVVEDRMEGLVGGEEGEVEAAVVRVVGRCLGGRRWRRSGCRFVVVVFFLLALGNSMRVLVIILQCGEKEENEAGEQATASEMRDK